MEIKIRITTVIITAVWLTLSGCAGREPEALQAVSVAQCRSYTPAEALGLACEALSKDGRSRADEAVECTVLRATKEQRLLPSDTVAYVFNYEEGGFAIVANCTGVDPILAYSDKGIFTRGGDCPAELFLARIEPYLASRIGAVPPQRKPDLPSFSFGPLVEVDLDQGDPFDQVVQKYHPGCPAGCGPVAMMMAMLYCKPSTTIGGTTYLHSQLISGLKSGKGTGYYDLSARYIAQILHELGAMVGCEYTTSATSSPLLGIRNAFGELGYCIGPFVAYDDPEPLIDAFMDGNLVFTYGMRYDEVKKKYFAHVWVMSGVSYAYSSTGLWLSGASFYCNWGWGGRCDGWYSGLVFKPTSSREYYNMQYFKIPLGQ